MVRIEQAGASTFEPAVGQHAHGATTVGQPQLGIEVGAPLLQVERVSSTYDDVAVEYRRGLYDTRRHHYFNELS